MVENSYINVTRSLSGAVCQQQIREAEFEEIKKNKAV